jgi:small subunit ribosomal protein S20
MPNTKSAKKALRSSLRKRQYNLFRKVAVKRALKDYRKSLSETQEKSEEALSKVFSVLDKAVKRNVIQKNNADRKKSRLYKQFVTSFNVQVPEVKVEKKEKKEPKRKSSASTAKPKTATAEKKPKTTKKTTKPTSTKTKQSSVKKSEK